MTPAWWQDWRGEICVIVASGQSAKEENLDVARGRCRAVTVNSSFELAPWADVLYAADGEWWRDNPQSRGFAGLKLTACERTAASLGIGLVRMADAAGRETESVITVADKGAVARGGNSGFQAINLAAQFGCSRILLVGFDFVGEHWHPPHARRPHAPRASSLARWAETLDRQKPVLDALGVEVINCSAISALKAYPKMPLAVAMSLQIAA